MRVLPILFNTDMVRAILEERKTCTRRLVKKLPFGTYRVDAEYDEDRLIFNAYYGRAMQSGVVDLYSELKPPYQPGDILYVRETWAYPINLNSEKSYIYKADTTAEDGFANDSHVWHPSIHMPKEAARIWLKVTGVQVERLQDITADQVVKEGTTDLTMDLIQSSDELKEHYDIPFAVLWDSTIKKSDLDRYSWKANPYVFVIEFERCEKPEESEA